MALTENLTRLIQEIIENPNHDIDEIKELLKETTEDEIRSSSKQFLQLCHILTDALVRTKRSVTGIQLMSYAIVKYQQHRSQLTPLHSDFCLLCLDSKCLNPALNFLEIDYTEIRKTDDGDDVRRLLLFYFYGGLIYAAIKNFERASYFFEVVLTLPTTSMNPIMQATYKKFVILNVLLNGKLQDNILPRYTSPCVLKQRKVIGHSYLKFASEYSSLNYDKLRRLVTANSDNFELDENMGLIKQCLTQVHKRNIQRLTKTFLTLPLKDVANYIGLDSEKEAELYVLNMIDDGEISATIDQKDGMVVFRDNSEKYDTVAVFQKLQENMSITMTLVKTLKKLELGRVMPDTRGVCKMISDCP